ncbi:hypothetical protein AB0J14_35230 [Micromonospora arborensis]|uniref:hypothetical protein n=1 Tax=Micromonospora TaxID=1873 RepID=UPI0033FCFF11
MDYLELPDDLDIRTLDFEAALGRLTMVRPDLAQNTIYGLRSLSRKGVRMFYRWMNGDSEWWHVTKHPARTQRRPARSFPVTVRFALRPEFDARLVVPSDLTAAEAKNLARFIEGLAP